MKFAHLADCHLGGWREPKLREANSASFSAAIDRCLADGVDFVIIAGDLFNTSVPPIESTRLAVRKLKELRDRNIPVYGIPGSHDFSPSGRTMIDVLESAGLFTNVAKGQDVDGKLQLSFTRDEKTGALLTGIFGRKGGLDKYYYQDLRREKLPDGFKIFVFHCALQELKPMDLEDMDAMSVSLLPKGFDYYAGGHVHVVDQASLEGYSTIVYPGPTFPNNFAELQKLGGGSFCVYDNGMLQRVPLQTRPIHQISLDCTHKTPQQVQAFLREEANKSIPKGAIVTIRLSGTLASGKPSDLVVDTSLFINAFVVLKNTYKVTSKEFENIRVIEESVEHIEEAIVENSCGQSGLFPVERERELVRALIHELATEKDEGMKRADFEKKIVKTVDALFDLENF